MLAPQIVPPLLQILADYEETGAKRILRFRLQKQFGEDSMFLTPRCSTTSVSRQADAQSVLGTLVLGLLHAVKPYRD